MTRTFGIVLGACGVLAVVLALGCGDDGQTRRAPPAGRQPLPSSGAPGPSAPSGGAQRPMFARPAHTDLRGVAGGGGMIATKVREDQERYERETRQRGPQRMGETDGQAIAAEIAAALPPSTATDPCEEAWDQRVAAHEAGWGPSPGGTRERRDFLDACGAMPEAQRNCMSLRYAREHGEECTQLGSQVAARAERETGVEIRER